MPSQCSAPLCLSRACPCFPLPSPLGPLPLLACPLLCPRASERRSPMPPPCQPLPRLRDALSRSAPADRCPGLPCLRFSLLCLGFALPLHRFAVLSHSFAAQSYAVALPCRASLSIAVASPRLAAQCPCGARLSIAVALPCDSEPCHCPALPCDSSASQRSSVPPLCSVVRLHNVASPSRLRAFPCQAFAARLAALPSRGAWFRVVCWRVAHMPLRRPERAVLGALAMWVGSWPMVRVVRALGRSVRRLSCIRTYRWCHGARHRGRRAERGSFQSRTSCRR